MNESGNKKRLWLCVCKVWYGGYSVNLPYIASPSEAPAHAGDCLISLYFIVLLPGLFWDIWTPFEGYKHRVFRPGTFYVSALVLNSLFRNHVDLWIQYTLLSWCHRNTVCKRRLTMRVWRKEGANLFSRMSVLEPQVGGLINISKYLMMLDSGGSGFKTPLSRETFSNLNWPCLCWV